MAQSLFNEKTKNIYGIFLRKFPKKNIYFWINNFILEENRNIYGNAVILSKSHWKIGLISWKRTNFSGPINKLHTLTSKVPDNPHYSMVDGSIHKRAYLTKVFVSSYLVCPHFWSTLFNSQSNVDLCPKDLTNKILFLFNLNWVCWVKNHQNCLSSV